MSFRLILVLVLSLTAMQCQDICSFLKPNGKYEGTGVYKYQYSFKSGGYYMFNKNGTEWQFDIFGDTVKEFENKTRTFDPSIVKRFGVRYSIPDVLIFETVYDKFHYNCYVQKEVILDTNSMILIIFSQRMSNELSVWAQNRKELQINT